MSSRNKQSRWLRAALVLPSRISFYSLALED